MSVTLVIYQESLHDAGQQNIKFNYAVSFLDCRASETGLMDEWVDE